MTMQKEYTPQGFEETQHIGEQLAQELLPTIASQKGAVVLALYGDLGSGKTTFTQGFAKGLGISQRIISPTFVIVRSYRYEDKNQNTANYNHQQQSNMLYHIDLYRIEGIQDIKHVGIEELCKEDNAIVIIEWPEKMGDILPSHRIEIRFEYIDEEKRKIIISKLDDMK